MHGTKFQTGTTTDFNICKFDSENSTKLSNGLPNTYFLPRCAIARFSWLRCLSLSAMVEHYLSNSNSKLTITTEYNYHYGNCYEDESLLSQSRYASYLLPSHIPLVGRAPSLSAFSTAFYKVVYVFRYCRKSQKMNVTVLVWSFHSALSLFTDAIYVIDLTWRCS